MSEHTGRISRYSPDRCYALTDRLELVAYPDHPQSYVAGYVSRDTEAAFAAAIAAAEEEDACLEAELLWELQS